VHDHCHYFLTSSFYCFFIPSLFSKVCQQINKNQKEESHTIFLYWAIPDRQGIANLAEFYLEGGYVSSDAKESYAG
jgi:hypothetical protein